MRPNDQAQDEAGGGRKRRGLRLAVARGLVATALRPQGEHLK